MPLDGAQPADDSSRSGLRIDHRVLKVDALLLLAFKPDSEKARAEMPASIYTFYSREAVQRMLDASGFCAADTVDYAFAARRILFMVPVKLRVVKTWRVRFFHSRLNLWKME